MNLSTVYVVDDDAAVRHGLTMLLQAEGLPVDSYDSGEAVLAACSPEWQGCMLLDLNLLGMDGLELQAELQRRGVRLPVLFLTGCGDIPTTVRAMKAGASDFLTKPVRGEKLIPLIRAALARNSEELARERATRAQRQRLKQLTRRELEILRLAVAGHANKEIARLLAISHRTVEVHRSHIMAKTQAGNLLELARLVLQADPQVGATAVTPDDTLSSTS